MKALVNLVCMCCEKQRKEASHFQTVNKNLTAMNKLLMEENDRLHLLAIAKETLAEFVSKATGTAVECFPQLYWLHFPFFHNVAEILKDRQSWYHDCRCMDVLSIGPTGNGGTIGLMYMQTYAPTTLAASWDFWTLRYTTSLEDGSLICERSLTYSIGGPTGPPCTTFVRVEMLRSGFLIRLCECGGSIIHIVGHNDLYITQESSGENEYGGGRQPVVLRTFSQRLYKGFNDAVINGFVDDSRSLMGTDGVEDVTIAINSSPNKL
ncbi:Homeobox-leucine zipper protein HOX32 [Glycine soja]